MRWPWQRRPVEDHPLHKLAEVFDKVLAENVEAQERNDQMTDEVLRRLPDEQRRD